MNLKKSILTPIRNLEEKCSYFLDDDRTETISNEEDLAEFAILKINEAVNLIKEMETELHNIRCDIETG